MTKRILYIKLLAGCIFLMLFNNACVKSFDGQIDDTTTNRAFQPYSFGVKTSRDTATFSWSQPVLSAGKRYMYTVDISEDSAFGTINLSKTVDTLAFRIIEPEISVGKKYFARMRVNAFKGSAPSEYLYLDRSFALPGENYLRMIRDFEITPTTVLVHWYANVAGLNKVVVTADKDAATSFDISSAENAAGQKLLTGLAPATKYTLQLFAGAKSKGITSFTTNKPIVYTTVLDAGGDLVAAINNAADSAVIGLNPGTYTLGSNVFTMTGKKITIASTSNNPKDTKINVRELDLVGTNAGIELKGVEINGNYSGTSYGVQFLVIKGGPNQGDPADFADVKLDNCIIHDYTRCLVLANLATTTATQKIKTLSINNCVIYNIDKAGTSTYYTFSVEKNVISNFNITKSTFYSMGAGLINMGTTLGTSDIPTITIDYCTFNNFGGSGKYLLIDANANTVSYTLKNSILANTPEAGTINGTAFRCTGTGRVLDFLNNNYFKLNATYGSTTPVSLTGLNQQSCISSDLGWTAATIDYSLGALPASHPVLKASVSGGVIGDPRWAY
ncbi:DUF4957 domain-containing protein [Pinibacter soli]|uniref:DUF4957 domain-containing protein n=1 Tax=Pinibacter soli TaxID=3044211 RepID=A0ABT6REL0_9BACT|nr:DUF4957 domain-containing protein [Pinibacter soli]MDI3320911.1 DUF4957 domain-containing protein [Pinibacter soli]